MPTNLYGPGNHFHAENLHMLPALIRLFHEAVLTGQNTVTVWGMGTPRHEFLHVDDMAAASLFVMNVIEKTYRPHTQPMLSHFNLGSESDAAIADLAHTIAEVVGFLTVGRFRPQQAGQNGRQAYGCAAPVYDGLGRAHCPARWDCGNL